MRKIDKIIIHCSATREGQEFNCADVTRWHKQKGWSDCGYHFVIKIDGTIEVGRPIDKAGAHAKGHNRNSVGICYIGGLSEDGRAKDTRTPEQVYSIRLLVGSMLRRFDGASVHGHNEFSSKSCPCFNVQTEL